MRKFVIVRCQQWHQVRVLKFIRKGLILQGVSPQDNTDHTHTPCLVNVVSIGLG